MNAAVVAALASALSGSAFAGDPDCTGPHRWPATMARHQLGGSEAAQAEIATTTVRRISSQEISKNQYRQVHLVHYVKVGGAVIRVLTVSDATHEECAGNNLEAYPVSQEITLPSQSRWESNLSSRKKDADCPGTLAAEVARRWLTDAGIVQAGEFDPTKAMVTRISSQQIGKNLSRQVHLVTLAKKSDEAIRAVVVDDLSSRACHVGKVEVYVISP